MAHAWEPHANGVDAAGALDQLAARAAHASIVLIGEASHGTRDFHGMRADLTRRLIADHGFRAVTLEADWPDTFRVHRYVTGRSDDGDAVTALSDFRRFPAWMWRNETMRALRERIPGAAEDTVVWAHNSHLGDARATEMSRRGEVNVGQLVRERYGPDVFSIGFSTFDGTVTAASDWDAPAERKRVRPGLAGSYERTFHEHGEDRFWLDLGDRDVAAALGGALLQRAIGVIYRPETERWSHYFEARLRSNSTPSSTSTTRLP